MNDVASPLGAHREQLTELRRVNLAAAVVAGHAKLTLVERLSIEGTTSMDFEFVRKTAQTLDDISAGVEKREVAKAGAAAATAIFNIIRDRSVQQVAPPRTKRLVRSAFTSEDATLTLDMEPAAVADMLDAADGWGAL